MLGYRHTNARSSGALQSLAHYREQEQLLLKQSSAAVTDDGALLEYEALELRIHPPNVRIDNESSQQHTILIIDSANRPGTLVEVVQCLTELGLSVMHARISSDGGWFVDEFHVSEVPRGRVTDPKKLDVIRRVLSVPEHTGQPQAINTVFQIAGPETPGLLAEVTQLLSHNGLQIRTAAAWTYCGRAAMVIGVTEHNAAVRDTVKLQRLQQLLVRLVEATGTNVAVSFEQVEGPVHHERRLHQLLLADDVQAWKQLVRLQRQHSLPFPGPIHTQQALAEAPDTTQGSDQPLPEPPTPQQQWQRTMLPPTWTFDPRGRPTHRDELLQAQQQQQQQMLAPVAESPQQQTPSIQLVQQRSSELVNPFRDAAAADVLDSVDAAGGSGLHATTSSSSAAAQQGSGGQQQLQQQQHGTAVLSAAAPPLSNATSAAASAARATAASPAQQASVDKLIALLQPHPLAHAISLPPVKAAQQQQQQQQTGLSGDQQGTRDQSEQQQGVAAAVQPPHLMAAAAADMVCAAPHAPEAAGRLAQPAAVRIPAATNAGSSMSIGSAAASGDSGTAMRPSSVSAPCSPCAPAAAAARRGAAGAVPARAAEAPEPGHGVHDVGGGSSSSAATGAADDAAGQQAGWSAGDFASAAAAAGLLSPRGPGAQAAAAGSRLGLSSAATQPLAELKAPVGAGARGSSGGGGGVTGTASSTWGAGLGRDAPEVQVQHSHLFNYILVEIRCRDRTKLFFDTVCTLADLRYDIFHATIDSEDNGMASQLFYVRPRFGECVWDEAKAAGLKAMLERAVQRRFPPGLRVHVFTGSSVCLQDLVSSFKRHKLTITRCKVRTYDNGSHTFFLTTAEHSLPTRQYVQAACQAAGGELVDAPLDLTNACVASVLRSLDARGRFAFSFTNHRAQQRAMQAAAAMQQRGGALGGAGGTMRGVHAPGGPMDIAHHSQASGFGAAAAVAALQRVAGAGAPYHPSPASACSSQQPSF